MDERARQLRDPAVFQEARRRYLLYATAGESGIAIARLSLDGIDDDLDADPGEAAGPAFVSYPYRPPDVQPSLALDADRLSSASERVLGFVNRTHGTAYRLERRLGGPESGRLLVRPEEGEPAILSWSRERSTAERVREAARALAAARAWGWPTPAWIAAGVTPSGFPYHLEEPVAGRRLDRIEPELASKLLAIIDLQAARDPGGEVDWSVRDRRGFFEDGAGRGLALAAACESGRRLLDELAGWVEPYREAGSAGGDLVHGDFRLANLRDDNGRVWLLEAAGVGRGSRFHDLATLLVDAALGSGGRPRLAAGVERQLLDYAARAAIPGEFELAVAATTVRYLADGIATDPVGADRQIEPAREWIAQLVQALSR